MAVFLGGPLYVVIHGAFTTENNQLTLNNFSQIFSQPQYTQALKNSLILALWTSVGPALFGLWFAAAVVAGKRDGMLGASSPAHPGCSPTSPGCRSRSSGSPPSARSAC